MLEEKEEIMLIPFTQTSKEVILADHSIAAVMCGITTAIVLFCIHLTGN